MTSIPPPGSRASSRTQLGRRRAALEVDTHADVIDRAGLGDEAGALTGAQAQSDLGEALEVAVTLGERGSKSLRCAERPG